MLECDTALHEAALVIALAVTVKLTFYLLLYTDNCFCTQLNTAPL